ncbi:hypothetical protein COBT_000371 [Conglomerata obtusa]
MHYQDVLDDYGIPVTQLLSKIKSNSTLNEILKINIPQKYLLQALAICIQKRFITSYTHNSITFYTLNNQNITRRLYFSLYINYINDFYGQSYSNLFEKILLRGICSNKKITDRLLFIKMLDCKILKCLKETVVSDFQHKKVKIDNCEDEFFVVDYCELEKKMFHSLFIDYLEEYYDKNVKWVFEVILGCLVINEKNIHDLMSKEYNKSTLKVNDLEKYVKNCFFLFKNDGLLIDDVKLNNYRINYTNIKQILKKQRMLFLTEKITSVKARRIFHLILEKKYIEDKEVIKYGLIDMKNTRKILFELYQLGLIQISYIMRDNKSIMVWEACFFKSSLLIGNILYNMINEKVQIINQMHKNTKIGRRENTDVYVFISDMINLAKDHFILNYY